MLAYPIKKNPFQSIQLMLLAERMDKVETYSTNLKPYTLVEDKNFQAVQLLAILKVEF